MVLLPGHNHLPSSSSSSIRPQTHTLPTHHSLTHSSTCPSLLRPNRRSLTHSPRPTQLPLLRPLLDPGLRRTLFPPLHCLLSRPLSTSPSPPTTLILLLTGLTDSSAAPPLPAMPAPTNGRVAHSPSGPSHSPNVPTANNLFAKTQDATESVWIAIGTTFPSQKTRAPAPPPAHLSSSIQAAQQRPWATSTAPSVPMSVLSS